MLTITGLIAKALATQSPKLVVLARITDQDSNDFYFMSGAHRPNLTTYLDYIQNIHAVTPVAPQIDPITRKAQSSSVTVTMVDDGSIREIMGTQPLKQATMTLRLTTADDTAGSTVGLWKGIIHDIIPAPGYIEIQCIDALALAFENYYYGLLKNQHPLEWVSALLGAAGVPAAFRNSTTLAWDNDTSLSHFVLNSQWTPKTADQTAEPDVAGTLATAIAAIDAGAWSEDVDQDVDYAPYLKIGEAVADIAFMLYGTIIADEEGEVGFKKFDATESVVATWTSEDILNLRQISTYNNMINEVQVELTSDTIAEMYVHRDTDSQTQHGLVGSSSQNSVLKVSLPLSCQEFWFRTPGIDSSQTTDIKPSHERLGGMCGTRTTIASFRNQAAATGWTDVQPFTVPTDARISAARKLWLKADGEIMSATGMTITSNADGGYWDLSDIDRYGEVLTTHSFYPIESLVSGVTRGAAGAAEAHTGQNPGASPFYDITIARYLAPAIVARAANGIPELSVETTFAQYAVQVGDLVDLEDDFPLWWGVDGVSSANQIKWEVIGKEVDALGSSDRIRWTLAYAAINTPPWTTTVEDDPIDPEFQPNTGGAPAIEVSLVNDQVVVKGTWVLVEYDAINWEQGLGTSIANHNYTAPVSGPYNIEAHARLLALDPGSWAELAIFIGGTATVFGPRVYNDGTVSRVADVVVSSPHQYLGSGEVVDIRLRHGSSADETISGDADYTWLDIYYTGG